MMLRPDLLISFKLTSKTSKCMTFFYVIYSGNVPCTGYCGLVKKLIQKFIYEIKQKLYFYVVLYEKTIKVWLPLSTKIMDYDDYFHFFLPLFHNF